MASALRILSLLVCMPVVVVVNASPYYDWSSISFDTRYSKDSGDGGWGNGLFKKILNGWNNDSNEYDY
ncbi:hypothetical protein KQX54_017187 [Cotesia glomerata]|uniref:Uncharacterized protein n=1 Tax=Cotesia glomerata TaxID=32391 RepID=A0AAV7ICN6_COTGL|nr:hypothetical protein KQX54_017187 [Cotesia glomerata]